MAANSALLAVQYTAGVPAPRCHLRRNLVTKSQYKTTIVAGNPAARYEASDLVSAPSRLHRRSVTKRDKTIVAAYPGSSEIRIPSPGFPELTDCVLENQSGKDLTLESMSFWVGSPKVDKLPESIGSEGEGKFEHLADTTGSVMGSVGYVVYRIAGENSRWIIAWRNSMNESNKVYTQILDKPVNGREIKDTLDQSWDTSKFQNKDFSTNANIDRTSARPKMTAKLQKLPLPGGNEGTPSPGGN